MAKIDAFFKLMKEQSASDLHLMSGQQPSLRIRGDLERIKYKVLEDEELRAMLYEITPEEKIKTFEEIFKARLVPSSEDLAGVDEWVGKFAAFIEERSDSRE